MREFDPWETASGEGWPLPAKRIDAAVAQALLERSAAGRHGTNVVAALIVAILRLIEKAIPLQSESDSPKISELLDIADKAIDVLHRLSRGAEGDETFPRLAETEGRAIRHSIRCFTKQEDAEDEESLHTAFERVSETPADPYLVGYRAYVSGKLAALNGDPHGAANAFRDALTSAKNIKAKRDIRAALLPELWKVQDEKGLERESEALISECANEVGGHFEIGWSHYHRALLFTARQEWNRSAEAGRLACFHFFQYGGEQAGRLVGAATYLTARGVFMQNEWHESELLAGLSLKGLQRFGDRPGRADALLLLARAALRHKNPAKARQALELLVENLNTIPDRPEVESEARRLLVEASASSAEGKPVETFD